MNYFGLDLSTQKLKSVIVDENLQTIHECEVHFDTQLPEFRTEGGAIKDVNGVVTSPVLMWVKALDLLLDRMQLDGVDFSRIKALSGTAQQHGSVFWQRGAKKKLENLDSLEFLHQQLQDCFCLKQSPIWMDSSTTSFCRKLESAVGGPDKMAKLTGSRTYERFTGPQLAKIIDTRRSAYDICERISLISSFACSLFLGDYADIDYADASGMNLMDITTKEWNEVCLEALGAPDIAVKLGKTIAPHSNLGKISDYFVRRFGFNPECRVVAFTGDNPASLAGLRLGEHDLAVSLGTSDTLLLPLSEPMIFLDGHVMCSALNGNSYMGMLCFKNGSLTRERIRNSMCNGSWEKFNELLNSTPRGNFGNIGLYFDNQEILPFFEPGEYRWNCNCEKLSRFPPEIEVRALLEGQFLARRAYAEDIGLTKHEDSRIIATGGASSNKYILQVLADIFNMPVYVQESRNSAVIGATYLAKLGSDSNVTYQELIHQLAEPSLACTPSSDSVQVYDPMVKKYRQLIANLLS